MDHSEVKHLPKVDHTPAELDDASKLLLAAAAIIERQGWCQCFIGTFGGQLCIEGALNVARGREPIAMLEGNEVTLEALLRVNKAVGASAFHWNDTPGRTKDEVVAKLRAVALGL